MFYYVSEHWSPCVGGKLEEAMGVKGKCLKVFFTYTSQTQSRILNKIILLNQKPIK